MNIAGVLVHARPADVETVEARLTAMTGVEVHAVNDSGRLVVTVEEKDYQLTSDRVLGLHELEGVLSAALIYQHSEEL